MGTNAYALPSLQSNSATKKVNQHENIDDIVAAMLLQVVHCQWEPSKTQKAQLLSILTSRPGIDIVQAEDLLGAASFVLHFFVADGFSRLLKQSKQRFSQPQKSSVVKLMEELARMDGPPNPRQKKLIEQTLQTLG